MKIFKKYLKNYYRSRIIKNYKNLIPTKSKILIISNETEDFLESFKEYESFGYNLKSKKFLFFSNEELKLNEDMENISDIKNKDLKFDYILVFDVLNEEKNIYKLFNQIKEISDNSTRIVANLLNNFWKWPIKFLELLNIVNRSNNINWITDEDVNNFFQFSDIQLIKKLKEISLIRFPFLNNFFDKFLIKLPFLNFFTLTNFYIFRFVLRTDEIKKYSIIIAARNEAGHIKKLIDRIPKFEKEYEIIFVEGGSKDNTYEEIEKNIKLNPNIDIKLFKQKGSGKGDAVRLGFEKSSGDILSILDADISVPPESLKGFFEVISKDKAEFVNGSRLVYPMEKKAMRFLNYLANKFFAYSFSYLLDQNIKDTLCGTKVLSKKNYLKIQKNRNHFGDFDPFGDFDLIFGANYLNLKLADFPITYESRKYGDTNISRFTHGAILLKMMLFASKKIKFI